MLAYHTEEAKMTAETRKINAEAELLEYQAMMLKHQIAVYVKENNLQK